MAKKVLTREESLKKGYRELWNLNQRLKNISKLYYISYDGSIYMKSLLHFVEIHATLRYPEKFEHFKGCVIKPNEFFQFGKALKISKLQVEEIMDEDGYHFVFKQSDYPDLSYTMHMTNPMKEMESSYLKEKIIPIFYKRLFEIRDTTKYEQFEESYFPLDNDQVEDLCDAKPVEFKTPYGDTIFLTKQLCLDIKKGDFLQIVKTAKQEIPGGLNEFRVFFMITHDTDMYSSYTLFNRVKRES